MTAGTMIRSSAPNVSGAPALPQVNLLPPEIRAGQRLRNLKPWLGIALLVTLLLAGLLAVWSVSELRAAEQELADAEDENTALLARQAEYAEVPQTLAELGALEDARRYGMAADTPWRAYIAAVAATAPAGVSFDSLSMDFVVDSAIAANATGTLGDTAFFRLSFEARSLTMPDTASWLDGLDATPGLANASFSVAEIDAEEDVPYYAVSGSVDVTFDALSLRYLAVELDDEEATD